MSKDSEGAWFLRLLYCVVCIFAVQNVDAFLDSNSNGMSDVWEKRYGAESVDPLVDDDDDGVNNLTESLAGTDPYLKSSVFSITSNVYYADSIILRWRSKKGVSYQIEKSNLLGSQWSEVGAVMAGNDGDLTMAFEKPTTANSFYRLKLLGSSDFSYLPVEGALMFEMYDSDGDGLNDLKEIRLGSDPFEAQSNLPVLNYHFGKSKSVLWDSKKGKLYRVECAVNPLGPWGEEGSPHIGTGGAMSASVSFEDGIPANVRVTVEDIDTDGDGVDDWEEYEMGLDPETAMTDPLGAGDSVGAMNLLNAGNVITVRAYKSVANITRMEEGGFLIERKGGLGEVTVDYTISGTAVVSSDYEATSGSVTIPFGERSAIVPVKPLASSTISFSKSVVLTLLDLDVYELGDKASQQVNVLKEGVINVKDYGAIGDGVVDDTDAIQAAIEVLESSSNHNTLLFPEGQYRLASYFQTSATPTGSHRVLRVGHGTDLSGRDLIFRGENGATLYSDVGHIRAHVLLLIGGFRSVLFSDLRVEQSSALLQSTYGAEPNGSDGVVIPNVDDRYVEEIVFNRCTFFNCHRSVSIYGSGYDLRGKCGSVVFKECHLLNPYGSNTSNGAAAWGGGQQVYLAPWVDRALYEDCLFDGGADDMTDTNLTGGGRMKDGCHFGGPLNLIFRNNVVKRMGVEAVYHTNDVTFMARTETDFAMPLNDGFSSVDVKVSSHRSTWEIGDRIVIHQSLVEGATEADNFFIIDEFNTQTSVLSLKHTGDTENAEPGTIIKAGKLIYRDQEAEPPYALIEGNYLDGSKPPGGNAFPERSGIVFASRALVQNNTVVNFTAGIFSYVDTHTPKFPAARGSIITNNVVITKNAFLDPEVVAKGIYLAAEDQVVRNNIIISPISFKTFGILHRGRGLRVVNNVLLCDQKMLNGYDSWNRSVGIAQSNTGIGLLAIGNRTHGFDVGIGPGQAYQWRSYYVRGHQSHEDTLAVDPIGLLQEP